MDVEFSIENTWHSDKPGQISVTFENGYVRLQSMSNDGAYHYYHFTPRQALELGEALLRVANQSASNAQSSTLPCRTRWG